MRKYIKIIPLCLFFLCIYLFTFCKKDKFISDPSARVHFSQDSVLFDTVFTSIGSSTKNIRIRNKNKQRVNISTIQLMGGNNSSFIINVDGSPGRNFSDVEIAANDSLYIFIQVKIDPTNQNSPLIINDEIQFNVNGNVQKVYLEAWGQDAYYHYPTNAIKFRDGSYLPYSRVSTQDNVSVTWQNDKPHVIYGYLVVDSTQKLFINAGTRVYMNYKAGLWVYRYGEIHVLGQKGNEVIFQGARRELDYADEPGQWDRIWINEGHLNNEIDYAIIKNGFVGIQAEVFGNTLGLGRLKLTNTKIQNMSLWGLYSLAYELYAGNNVISNCKEHSVNLQLGGKYTFLHCTFANYWNKSGARTKTTLNINNYSENQVLPLDSCYFGNCIIDGKLTNEINLDLKYESPNPNFIFSNSWLKTNNDVSNPSRYLNVRTGSDLDYEDKDKYNFKTKSTETRIKGFMSIQASSDALRFPLDISGAARNTSSVTAGAYEVN